MTKLTVQLPEKVLERLEAEAKLHAISVSELLLEVIGDYFDGDSSDSEADEDEPTKEEILSNLRDAMIDSIAGKNLRPFDEVMAELQEEFLTK